MGAGERKLNRNPDLQIDGDCPVCSCTGHEAKLSWKELGGLEGQPVSNNTLDETILTFPWWNPNLTIKQQCCMA